VDLYIKYIDEDVLTELAEASTNRYEISKRLREEQGKMGLLNQEIAALKNELSRLKEENRQL
jgi:predicted nuclease with TOPRIM domain